MLIVANGNADLYAMNSVKTKLDCRKGTFAQKRSVWAEAGLGTELDSFVCLVLLTLQQLVCLVFGVLHA